mmetsp:Transcript_63610/g.145752  ORF Transcript_63610/g.145752 Transcript_63610/m.145752 type:complete len:240 (-) Transcript_63610:2-721(-)
MTRCRTPATISSISETTASSRFAMFAWSSALFTHRKSLRAVVASSKLPNTSGANFPLVESRKPLPRFLTESSTRSRSSWASAPLAASATLPASPKSCDRRAKLSVVSFARRVRTTPQHTHTHAARRATPPIAIPASPPAESEAGPLTVEMLNTSSTEMPAKLSAELRLAVVMRRATVTACSAETTTRVSTTTDVTSSLRLRPVVCSTTERIKTEVSATSSAAATPETYAALVTGDSKSA